MESIKERNRQIYERHLNGATYSELTKRYSITSSGIREVCKREKRREEYRSNAMYRLLVSLCEDEKFATRTFTVLRRIGATTEEEIVKLDRETLQRTRNCGQAMEQVIMKMKEHVMR